MYFKMRVITRAGLLTVFLFSLAILIDAEAQKSESFQKSTIERQVGDSLGIEKSKITYQQNKTKLTRSTDTSKMVVVELEVNRNGTTRYPSWIMTREKAIERGILA